MKTKYLAPICAGLVGLTGLGFMGKALIDERRSYSFENFPEIRQLLELQNERYTWNYELTQTRQISAREVLEDKHYSSLLEKVHNSEIQEKELLRNPKIKTKYDEYMKSQSAMMDGAWKDTGLGFGLFIPGMIGLGIWAGRRKK